MSTSSTSQPTNEDDGNHQPRKYGEQFVERIVRSRTGLGARWQSWTWTCDIQLFRERNSKRGWTANLQLARLSANESGVLNSLSGRRTYRDSSRSRANRDKEPVRGVEQAIIGSTVGVIRLIDWIGSCRNVDAAGMTCESDGRFRQGRHPRKEVAVVGLAVRTLLRSRRCLQRKKDHPRGSLCVRSEGISGVELRALHHQHRRQDGAIGPICNRNRKTLTHLVTRRPLCISSTSRQDQTESQNHRCCQNNCNVSKGRPECH